eukprot:scaffold1014_cov260-Pinguiococcus_pyrenoidosus.AAC.9
MSSNQSDCARDIQQHHQSPKCGESRSVRKRREVQRRASANLIGVKEHHFVAHLLLLRRRHEPSQRWSGRLVAQVFEDHPGGICAALASTQQQRTLSGRSDLFERDRAGKKSRKGAPLRVQPEAEQLLCALGAQVGQEERSALRVAQEEIQVHGAHTLRPVRGVRTHLRQQARILFADSLFYGSGIRRSPRQPIGGRLLLPLFHFFRLFRNSIRASAIIPISLQTSVSGRTTDSFSDFRFQIDSHYRS